MPQGQIYLGELAAGGTRMNPPRRLTNDEANYMATAWAPDSKAVLFFSSFVNGPPGIFKQKISQDATEPVVAGPERTFMPRLSPDGAWILYLNWSKTVPALRVMRIPQGGGVSEFVTEIGPNWQDFQCARSPANLCVVLESRQDDKQITFTALDPVKGRGKILRTIEKDPGAVFSDGISPDGSTLAISQNDEAEIHIRLLSLAGGPDREITVKGWPNVSGLDWSPDGKAFYVGSVSPQGLTLLHVDLKGNARVLWEYKGTARDNGNLGIFGLPSPDGRYLAISGNVSYSNVWMLEGF